MSENLEHPFVGAYWSARKETREESAQRIFQFLSSIQEIPIFSNWYFPTKSRKKRPKPLEISLEGIAKKLGVQRTDIGREIMEEAGFDLYVWNENDKQPVTFSSSIGCYCKFVGNYAVLDLPMQAPPSTREEMEFLNGLMQQSIEAFDPEFAVVTSSEYRERAQVDVRELDGWLVYRKMKGKS